MSSIGPTIPYMEAPIPFITDVSGKWEINKEAMDILERIYVKITVVAIVGKYRTGKSFLMNRLAGKESGFALGAKVEAQTKGIWMWATTHQKHKDTCMILLDTEGLYDVQLSDETRDMQIFTFSVLLSRCLVFNTVGSIDSNFIKELELVAELTESIKVKDTKDKKEESGAMFSLYFPSLFVVLRDFFLELEIEGKPVTPAEYLEKALELKQGKSRTVLLYNAPREAIRDYFKDRTCFALPKPVENDKLLSKLDRPDTQIKPEFLEKSEEALTAILDEASPMSMDGNKITGSSFIHLTKMYVACVNDGAVPCIESAIEVMKRNECTKACEAALKAYQKNLDSKTEGKLPMGRDELENIHFASREIALDVYRKRALADDSGKYAKQLEDDGEAAFQLRMIENNTESEKLSNQALSECFAAFESGMKNGDYFQKGGHEKYKSAKDEAEKKYKELTGLGPMRDRVLHDYMKTKTETENAIIQADNKLSEEEKKQAVLKEQMEQQKENQRLQEEARKEMQQQMDRQAQEQANAIAKLQADNNEKFMKMMEEQQNAVAKKEEAMQKLLEQGLNRQAEEYKTQIGQMKEMMNNEKINRLEKDLQAEQVKNVENKKEIEQMKSKKCAIM